MTPSLADHIRRCLVDSAAQLVGICTTLHPQHGGPIADAADPWRAMTALRMAGLLPAELAVAEERGQRAWGMASCTLAVLSPEADALALLRAACQATDTPMGWRLSGFDAAQVVASTSPVRVALRARLATVRRAQVVSRIEVVR